MDEGYADGRLAAVSNSSTRPQDVDGAGGVLCAICLGAACAPRVFTPAVRIVDAGSRALTRAAQSDLAGAAVGQPLEKTPGFGDSGFTACLAFNEDGFIDEARVCLPP